MALITETQIVNRALQYCGAQRIAAGLFRTEDSKNAEEARACYDMLRQAELRRNVWRFSIRETVIRGINEDTRQVTFPLWSSVTSYAINNIVRGTDGRIYISRVAANLNHDPVDPEFVYWGLYFGNDLATVWDEDTSFSAGELAYVSTTLYLSLQNLNEDNDPASSPLFWLEITGATLAEINFIYPIGAGPTSNTTTRNVYKLPVGFMREAPQDPKRGAWLWLGAPAGNFYTDWYYEGDYLTSMMPGPILYRFAADVDDPSAFDPMFSEGFATRLALSLSEVLSQSVTKTSALSAMYAKFMGEARIVNAIEQGPVEPPEDSYVTCRY